MSLYRCKSCNLEFKSYKKLNNLKYCPYCAGRHIELINTKNINPNYLKYYKK